MSSTSADIGETIIKLIDKLAGKGSDIKLSFQDLTCEAGPIKAKLNGSIVLDVQYVSEKKWFFSSNGGTLQTFTLLSHVLKSGELQLFTNDVKVLELEAKNQRIDLNIVDNEFLKDVLRDSVGAKSFLKKLAYLKNIAEELKNENVTITVSYKGTVVLTFGSDTKTNLSRLITGKKEIEINNLRKLIQMGL